MKKGESILIYPMWYYKKVTYSSTDFRIAEVNNIGRVKAKRTGIVIIKVKAGKKILKCQIKVVE